MAMKPVPFAQASEEEQARRLRSLWEAVLQASTAGPQPGCACCSARLDVFVGDWLLGVDVARRQPAVWQHLQVCQGCRAEFEALAELLALEVEAVLRG
jgi:hypothetical protein